MFQLNFPIFLDSSLTRSYLFPNYPISNANKEEKWKSKKKTLCKTSTNRGWKCSRKFRRLSLAKNSLITQNQFKFATQEEPKPSYRLSRKEGVFPLRLENDTNYKYQ